MHPAVISCEERVTTELTALCAGQPVRFLHDRCVPGTLISIDHVAVAPSGIHVIDARFYARKVTVEVAGGIRRPKVEMLRINGRARPKLVDGVERQVEVVRDIVGDEVAVHGALCFVDSDLPLLGTPSVRGIVVAGPRRLAKRLKAPGTLDDGAIDELFNKLAAELPPAAAA